MSDSLEKHFLTRNTCNQVFKVSCPYIHVDESGKKESGKLYVSKFFNKNFLMFV